MSSQFDQVVIILADGVRPDLMQNLLDQGKLPGIAGLFPSAGAGNIDCATTVFPSTTGPAHLPFVTGQYPGRCNIPGIRWFDPEAYGGGPLSAHRFRSYMGLGNFFAASDLAKDVPTLFELVADHTSIAGNVRRGVRFSRDLTRWAKLKNNVQSFLAEEWSRFDRVVGKKMVASFNAGHELTFAVFYAADSLSHKFGPEHAQTLGAYQVMDEAVAELHQELKRTGRLERTLVALVSDHGQSATAEHLDLHQLVEKEVGRCLAHPTIWRGYLKANAAVMVSGNAMANVYLKGRQGWSSRIFLDEAQGEANGLLKTLLGEEAVDLVLGRALNGGAMICGKGGSARVSREGNKIRYEIEGTDPLGCGDRLQGCHDDRELLALTWDSDYPDAPMQALQLIESARCGHLVLSATPGYDLRARFEKPAHLGSHGSLHRLHMRVPQMFNHPLNGRTSSTPNRTVDVFPTILKALGVPAPGPLAGDSLI
jgi:hypothetical protein